MQKQSRHRLQPSPSRDARVITAACEALEGRAYFAATYSVGDFDNDGTVDLRVRGSSAKEHVVITEDPVNGTTTLWLDQDFNNSKNSRDVVKTFNTPFETIDVDLSSGDDTLEYYAISSFDFMTRGLHLDTGSGNDKLIVDASGENNGAFSSTIVCDFDLDSGHDTASIKMGAVDNSLFRLNLDGGSNNDTISIFVQGDIATASVDIDVNLGTGKNKLDVSSPATITGGSNFFLDVQGGGAGSEYDHVTTSFTNEVQNSRLFVTANLQGGNDTFMSNLDLQGFDVRELALVRFSLNGGDGNDTIGVSRGGTVGFADIDPGAMLEIRLAGGNGNDNVKLDLGGNEEHNRGLFLTGRMVVNMDGQAGNDTVSADLSFAFDPASFGDLQMQMFGGSGNDTMLLNLLDFFPLEPEEPEEGEEPDPDEEPIIPPQVGFTYGPTGFLTMDAGTGSDKTTLSGTVLSQVRVRNSEKLTVIPFTDVFF
jgi:hypothetical protein